jgi:VCBS repeat-containing protein
MEPHPTSLDAPAHAQALPPGFDGLEYIASNPDLVTALGADPAAGERHYLSLGAAEGRAADTFDDGGYLARYPDLQAAFDINFDVAVDVNVDVAVAVTHYIQFGFAEGRTDGSPGSANTAPMAVADTGAATEDGGPVRLDVLANDIDRGAGNDLTIVAVEKTGTVGAVWIGPNGRVVYNPGDAFRELNTGQSATDTFAYTIEDEAGAQSTATVTMTVAGADPPLANTTPTAVADTGAATEDGGPVRLDVLANDIDLDQGDSLVVVAVEKTGTVGAVWIGPNSRVVYNPGDAFQELNGGQSATDTFAYTIEDEAGAQSTATVTMTVAGVHEPPVLPMDVAASDFLL